MTTSWRRTAGSMRCWRMGRGKPGDTCGTRSSRNRSLEKIAATMAMEGRPFRQMQLRIHGRVNRETRHNEKEAELLPHFAYGLRYSFWLLLLYGQKMIYFCCCIVSKCSFSRFGREVCLIIFLYQYQLNTLEINNEQ